MLIFRTYVGQAQQGIYPQTGGISGLPSGNLLYQMRIQCKTEEDYKLFIWYFFFRIKIPFDYNLIILEYLQM